MARGWRHNLTRACSRRGANPLVRNAPLMRIIVTRRKRPSSTNKEDQMDPAILGPLVPIAAIIAYAAVKIARLRAPAPASLPPDVTARLEALEQRVDGLDQELAETHERLDFAERLLSQAREERRING